MHISPAPAIALLCLLSLSTPGWSQPYPDTPPTGIRWGWQGYAQFSVNSAAIRPQDRTLLLRVAGQMQRHPTINLLLTGHTDNTGDPDYNQRLSQRRDQAVADFIASHGVGLHRITQRGVGELRPVASNNCDRDRQRNRRVDLAYFPIHRTPPEGGANVYSPSQPEPEDEAGACDRPPPPTSRRSSSASSRAGSGSSRHSASASSRTSSAVAVGAPSAAGSPSAPASHRPTPTGSAPRWINPDDPVDTAASASSRSSSNASGPDDASTSASSRNTGSTPGYGGAPYKPTPPPSGIEF